MGLMKNTVRLMAEFTSFSDVLADPSGITLEVYEKNTGTSLMSFSGSSITRESLGVYYANFTVPKGVGTIEYEWSGTMESYPIVNRGIISREWLRL